MLEGIQNILSYNIMHAKYTRSGPSEETILTLIEQVQQSLEKEQVMELGVEYNLFPRTFVRRQAGMS